MYDTYLNDSMKSDTYSSPIKAIQPIKINLKKPINSKHRSIKILKNLATKILTSTNNVADKINSGKSHTEIPKINNYGNNYQINTKDCLGVMALIAIMEPAIESQASRGIKQPLKSRLSNKIKVLLDSGSDGDLYFLPKGKGTPFPYLAW